MRTGGNICPDLARGAAKTPLQPRHKCSLLVRHYVRFSALPAIDRQNFPAIAIIKLEPCPDRVIVQIQEPRDLSAAFTIIQQQKRIGPPCYPMILPLAAHTTLKLEAVLGGEKIWSDHKQSRIHQSRNVNKLYGLSRTRGI